MLEAAGIKMNVLPQTTAEIITKAFPQQYQAMPLLIMEGTGTGFILPFLVSDTSGGNPTALLNVSPRTKILYSILNLSAFKDTVSENLLFAARAESNMAKKKKLYQDATAQLQAEARLTSLFRTTYMLSYKDLGGVGVLPLAAGGQRRLLTNFGIDWTGVWSTK